MDLISVIVPVYNVEPYLHRCVDSLLAQSYCDLEILLVDDGSPDTCGAICDGYAKEDNRVRVIHKANGGLSDARNAGIDAAHGMYLCCVDSDDFAAPGFVDYLHTLIIQNDCDMAICNYADYYDETGRQIPFRPVGSDFVLTPEEALTAILYEKEFNTSAWGKLYKISLFDGIRYPVGKLYEDLFTLYRQIDRCRAIAYGSEIQYYYLIRADSILHRSFHPGKMDMIEAAQQILEYVDEYHPALHAAACRRCVYSGATLLRQMVFTAPRDKRQERQTRQFILRYGGTALCDKNTPRKDKLAVIAVFFGISVFKGVWALYSRLRRDPT